MIRWTILSKRNHLLEYLVNNEVASACQIEVNKDKIIVVSFLTEKEHRRKGYAKLLLKELTKNHLTKYSMHCLVTFKNNTKAKKLYESSGFVKILTGTKYTYYERYPEN